MSSNYDENGNKLIHVKAYNRSDGTYVKEHWRGQGESFAQKQEEYDWPPKEEKYELPDEGCFPYGSDDVMYMTLIRVIGILRQNMVKCYRKLELAQIIIL